MTDTELAWAAGFFDGEGWVGARYAKVSKKQPLYRRIEVGIGQVDPRVLERFQAAVGGVGTVKGPYAPDKRGGRQPRWYYQLAGPKTIWRIFWDLEPYLSPVKREQFLTALNWYEESPVSLGREVISHR